MSDELQWPPHSLMGEDKIKNLLRILDQAPRHGVILEIGVYQGGSLYRIADHIAKSRRQCAVIGVDTFLGLPHTESEVMPEGRFKFTEMNWLESKLKETYQNLELYKAESGQVPHGFLLKRKISFVHLDVDTGLSTKLWLEYIKEHIKPLGKILIDDHEWIETPYIKPVVDSFCFLNHDFSQEKIGKYQVCLTKIY